ncbi:hypothetical protein C8F04DRAFT_1254260 [Mycena alexandri]|uniref:KOW domain-containing protein n=1 Tax=Mycena alexandri TaxID=1745969 RepID=A0AAD6T970_9AGAR|nr:hypothetical protein C8F04DRAFT_1254260 [Mycena alexandri]
MSPNPFIDDRAEEVPDVEMNDDGASDGESDSEEARIRREDRRLFKMPEILATHDARLQEPGPYRIPTRLLPSGAATPARHEDQLDDMPSRAPSPTIPSTPALPNGLLSRYPGSSCASPRHYLSLTPIHEDRHHSANMLSLGAQRPPLNSACKHRSSTSPSLPSPTPPLPVHRNLHRLDFNTPSTPNSPRSRSSSPPPRKRTKTSYINTFAFLDLDAEQSGDDDEPDDPNEDEETLSDKEFLDDEPVHDFHRPPSFRPVADDTDDGDELRALAQHYEDEAAREVAREVALPQQARPAAPRPAMPLAAGTWIRYRNRLSFVVSSKEVLQVVDGKIKEVAVAQELTNATLTVIPTRDHTDPFRQTISHPSMAKATFTGVCPALTAGDRVVIVSGDLKHRTGATYILSIRESLRDNKRVRVAHVSEVDSRQQVTKFDVEVSHLKRHILDPFCPIQIHDRVCVVSGLLHRGLSGRVTDLSDGVVSATDGTRQFTVDVRHVARDLRCGDLVRVSRGNFVGRVGLILEVLSRGLLEIWDGEHTQSSAKDSENSRAEIGEAQAQTLRLRARDVEFADYGLTAYSTAYTRTSEVGPHQRQTILDQQILDNARQEGENLRLGLQDYNAFSADLHDEKTREEVRNSYMFQIAKAAQPFLVNIHERDQLLKEAELKLAHTGRRFEGFEVFVSGQNKYKGFRGMVIGDHDTAERVRRLKRRRRHADDVRDTKGIEVTIRHESSNSTINVAVEDVRHIHTRMTLSQVRYLPKALLQRESDKALAKPKEVDDVYLPDPSTLEPAKQVDYPNPDMPLVGESTGEWAFAPEFQHVRIDVQVVGVRFIAGASTKIRELEGKKGYLLAVNGVERVVNNKIVVRGVGKNGLPVNVPQACVTPLRVDDDGRRLNEVQLRVVVIGPDVTGGTREKGKYGFTVPASSTPRVVEVQFPDTLRTPFPYASLCLAKNVGLHLHDHHFEATPVPAN